MNDFKPYKNLSEGGGIIGYKIIRDGIILKFGNRDEYQYDYLVPGKEHVEQMKILAEQGKELTTYVNKYVRGNYRSKLT